jgi:hypothetical protein
LADPPARLGMIIHSSTVELDVASRSSLGVCPCLGHVPGDCSGWISRKSHRSPEIAAPRPAAAVRAPRSVRDIASKVDSNGVAEKRCHVNWGHSRSVPDQSDRVSDAVQADYGDPSLPAEVLESVAVRVGLDGLSERGSQRLGEGRGAHIMSLTPPRAPGAGSVSGPLRSCPRP